MNFELDRWSGKVKLVTVVAAAVTVILTAASAAFNKPWTGARNIAFAVTLLGLAHGMWENYCESGQKRDLGVAWIFLLGAALTMIRL